MLIFENYANVLGPHRQCIMLSQLELYLSRLDEIIVFAVAVAAAGGSVTSNATVGIL